MAKKNPVPPKKSNKPIQTNPKNLSGTKKAELPKSSIVDLWENTFRKYLPGIFYVCIFLTILLGIYLFDVKISPGGDDSDYILSAKKFMEGKEFPTWHGSFYPIFLSLPLLIFGVNVIVLKILSFILMLGNLIFIYYAFRNRIPSLFLSLILLWMSVNSFILYYASQTYSEALYMFLQAVSFFIFFKVMDISEEEIQPTWKRIRVWLLFGFFVFLLAITRPVGYSMLLAILFYFMTKRQFLHGLYAIASFLVFYIPFSIYKWIVWGMVPGKSGGRYEEIFYKNLYNKAEGTEDLHGMIVRFFDNSMLYLSKHFMKILNLKDQQSTETSGFVTFLMFLLFFIALFYAIKRKNRVFLFLSFYLALALAITFLTLQKNWDQTRMILIYVPVIMILFTWGLHQFFISGKLKFVSLAIVGFMVIIFFISLSDSGDKAKHNQKVLSKNLKGNLYYGFTPDWQNFLKMSEWVGKNLPESTVVASRKPSMSFIYSKGKEFYPMYRYPTENADSLIANLEKRVGPLIALNEGEMQEKNVSFPLTLPVKRDMVAIVSQENDVYSLYRVPGMAKSPLETIVNQYKLSYLYADSLIRILHANNKSYYGISPDTLLTALRNNKVEYVVMASLRAIPTEKTERIINTIQRYLYTIEMKYPGIFSVQHQIGGNDDEPAWLYHINYSYYGFALGKP